MSENAGQYLRQELMLFSKELQYVSGVSMSSTNEPVWDCKSGVFSASSSEPSYATRCFEGEPVCYGTRIYIVLYALHK